MRLIGYLRVSTTGQADDGYGLKVQRADIQKWAKANGHQVVKWYEDAGVSGTATLVERPGLAAAVDALRPPPQANGLVVARQDRLARQLTVQEAILATVWQAGGSVFSADSGEILQDDPDDPVRTLVRQVLGSIAEFDRALINKRLKAGRAAKAEAGGFAYGSPPYGWRSVNGDLVAVPEEQEALSLMVTMREDGASLPAICTALSEAGHTTKRGGTWHPTTVAKILARQ